MASKAGWRKPLIALGIVAGVLILAVGTGAVFLASFDPNSEKPRIIALVRQATGRDLTLNGKIHLALSLQPTFDVSEVAFANPTGFSRPEMVTLQRLEVRIRLLPLLSRRVEIERLVLVQPDIRLETNVQGHNNWTFDRKAGAPAQPLSRGQPSSASASRESDTPAFGLQNVQIRDGTVTYRDDVTGRTTTFAVQQLMAHAPSPDAPLHLTVQAAYNATPFSLTGETGSLIRLQDPTASIPWPVKLTLQTGSATLDISGVLTRPLQGRGYDLTVSGSLPDLGTLAPLSQQLQLPPLHDVRFNTRLADQGQLLPNISALTLHAGASDLGATYPGLSLDRLDIEAPALDRPTTVAMLANIGTTPVNLDATAGALGLLLAKGPTVAAFPVDATVRAAGATLTAKGQIAQPLALTGVDLDVAAQIPDLGALAPLARRPLPALKAVSLTTTFTDTGAGIRHGIALRQLRLATPDGDLAGEATAQFGGKPTVTAALASSRIDIDALQATPEPRPGEPPTPPSAPPQAVAPAPPGKAQGAADSPIRWNLLQQANADLSLSITALRAGGTDIKAIKTHLVLRDGKLNLDPLIADLPTGHLEATAGADTTVPSFPVSLMLHDPGLPVRPLLAVAGEPGIASGNLEIYADVHGAGATPKAIAASLDGTIGIAMANGTIDNRVLGATLARILQGLNALNLVGRGGTSDVHCVAAHLDFRHGDGSVRGLVLSSSLLTMTGGGSVNLASDTLDLLVKPEARIAGTTLVVPMRVTGPITSPAARVDTRGTAEDNAGTVAGAILGDATPLGLLGGVLGADKIIGGNGDVCAGPLALARGQAAPSEATQRSKPKATGAAGVLQQLFH